MKLFCSLFPNLNNYLQQSLMLFLLLSSSCLTQDTLTDEEVLKIYKKATKEELTLQHLCIHRPKAFKDVVVVGAMVSDEGCIEPHLIVGKEYGEMVALTPKALKNNGWENVESQEDIAFDWVTQALLAFEKVMYETNDDFRSEDTPEFSQPMVQNISGNIWQVDVWVIDMSGLDPITNYYKYRVQINSEAEIIYYELEDLFEVVMQ